VLGELLDHAQTGLLIGLAAALVWHYLQLHRLLRQLDSRARYQPPTGWGVFSEVQERLFLRQRESRQRKQRLRTLLQAFREAAAALPDAVIVLRLPGYRIAWFNAAAVDLLGLRHPDDIGACFTHLLRTPQVSDWLRGGAVEPLLDTPSPLDAQLRLSLRLVDYTHGQKLLIARDVSKLMQLEQMRRDFVANVSHELRTPLTVLHGYLDMLEPGEHSEWDDLLTAMRMQSQRMTRLVEDLLALSRLESRDQLVEGRVGMRAQLQQLRREAEALSGGRHQLVFPERVDFDLYGADQELHSAFSNLLSNAIRYTPAGGRIDLQAERTAGGGARIVVRDTGPGIAPQHLPRITERFYRVSASRSRASGGTGLGLAIVKHVLQRHQARLEIHSEIGCGSEFACVFDAARVLSPEDARV